MRVVIDTNVLLMSIPKGSKYRLIFDALISGKYQLIISNEILSEYLEIIEHKTTAQIAKNIGEFILNSRFVDKIEVFYKWKLITKDPDDNKFVDCAIAGNVKYVVTNDKHFNELQTIEFPRVDVISIDGFLAELENLGNK